MGVTEEAGKVATTAVSAMQSQPLAIALLLVNVMFVGFCAYILGIVGSNATERNKGQMELISKMITDIRDCRQGKLGGFRLPEISPHAVPVNNNNKTEVTP